MEGWALSGTPALSQGRVFSSWPHTPPDLPTLLDRHSQLARRKKIGLSMETSFPVKQSDRAPLFSSPLGWLVREQPWEDLPIVAGQAQELLDILFSLGWGATHNVATLSETMQTIPLLIRNPIY